MTAKISCENDGLIVSGELNFHTVGSLWKQSLPLLSSHKKVHIDLEKVTLVNSAGLSLLLEWIKLAKRENKSISFKNMPEQLISIAKMAGISDMLMQV